MNGEGRELLQHVGGAARRARDDLVVAANELVEMILALHARVLVDRHAPSVLSDAHGAMAGSDARGRDRTAGTARGAASRRPLGSIARPACLALATDRPTADAEQWREWFDDGALPDRRRARDRVRDRARLDRHGGRLDALPGAATRAPQPRDRLDVARAVGLGHRSEHRGEAPPARVRVRGARLQAGRVQDGRPRTSARTLRLPPSRPSSRESIASTCSCATARTAIRPGTASSTTSGLPSARRSEPAWSSYRSARPGIHSELEQADDDRERPCDRRTAALASAVSARLDERGLTRDRAPPRPGAPLRPRPRDRRGRRRESRPGRGSRTSAAQRRSQRWPRTRGASESIPCRRSRCGAGRSSSTAPGQRSRPKRTTRARSQPGSPRPSGSGPSRCARRIEPPTTRALRSRPTTSSRSDTRPGRCSRRQEHRPRRSTR